MIYKGLNSPDQNNTIHDVENNSVLLRYTDYHCDVLLKHVYIDDKNRYTGDDDCSSSLPPC